MAYTKQTWETGDTITAEKLNHMEDGIATEGGGIVVLEEDQEGSIGVSVGDLIEYASNGKIVIFPVIQEDNNRVWVYYFARAGYSDDDSAYKASFVGHNGDVVADRNYYATTTTDLLRN